MFLSSPKVLQQEFLKLRLTARAAAQIISAPSALIGVVALFLSRTKVADHVYLSRLMRSANLDSTTTSSTKPSTKISSPSTHPQGRIERVRISKTHTATRYGYQYYSIGGLIELGCCHCALGRHPRFVSQTGAQQQ